MCETTLAPALGFFEARRELLITACPGRWSPRRRAQSTAHKNRLKLLLPIREPALSIIAVGPAPHHLANLHAHRFTLYFSTAAIMISRPPQPSHTAARRRDASHLQHPVTSAPATPRTARSLFEERDP